MSDVEQQSDFLVGTLSPVYASDWIYELARANGQRIQSVTEDYMDFLTRDSVEHIFTLCVRLRLPHDVRFKAALIFDRFMSVQTKTLYDFIAHSNRSESKKEQEWEKIETNLARQVTLRMASAIQIASKDQSYHTSLSTNQTASFLKNAGCPYTKRAILQSELRVMKTLDFRVPCSPLVYPESILKYLNFYVAPPLKLDIEACWEHVLLYMDVVFLHHKLFYDYLLDSVTPERCNLRPLQKLDRARVRADWTMLGSGIVAASIYCVHGSAVRDQMMEPITCIGGTPPMDIKDMCTSLIKVVKILEEQRVREAQ